MHYCFATSFVGWFIHSIIRARIALLCFAVFA